jgi:hypothetical protein
MPIRIFFWSLLIALGTVPANQSVMAAQSTPPSILRDDARITKEFQDRVKAYIQLQKQLEHMLPALKQSRDESEIHEHQLALRRLVSDARRHAHRGDIFTKDISRYYRAVIAEVLRSPAASIVQRTIDEKEPSKPIAVSVNGVFPDDAPVQTTPPTLLMRLPVLPMELSYRFVGRDLVLLDNKTNLIVDFIPDVLP